MAAFKAGKGGRTSVNGVNMANQSWSALFAGDELDCSNFEGNGRKSWLIGLERLEWDLGTLWDSAANPLSDPPGLYVRDDGTQMKLFANVNLNKYWDIPNWVCSQSKMDITVSGLVQFSASGKAQEDFSYVTVS